MSTNEICGARMRGTAIDTTVSASEAEHLMTLLAAEWEAPALHAAAADAKVGARSRSNDNDNNISTTQGQATALERAAQDLAF